jgi:hypothetical protein
MKNGLDGLSGEVRFISADCKPTLDETHTEHLQLSTRTSSYTKCKGPI